MKFNFETIFTIFWFIMVFCIIIGLTIFMLSKLSPKDICQSLCDYHNGTYYIMSDCEGDTLACSGWCEYENKSVFCKDLLNEINSSI